MMADEAIRTNAKADRLEQLLGSNLTSNQIADKLRAFELRVSGTKPERVQRLANHGPSVSDILNSLKVPELRCLCEYAGVRPDRKAAMIDGLIDWIGETENVSTVAERSRSDGMLETFIRIATADLKERIAVKGFESALVVVFRGGFEVALGPLAAYAVPIAKFVSWLGLIGYRTRAELKRVKVAGTVYELRTEDSGLLVAQNPRPETLDDMPIQLPARLEVPVGKLIGPARTSNLLVSNAHKIEPLRVFADFRRVQLACQACGQQWSHASNCARKSVGLGRNVQALEIGPGKCPLCRYAFFHAPGCILDTKSTQLTPSSVRQIPSVRPISAVCARCRGGGRVRIGRKFVPCLTCGGSGRVFPAASTSY